MADAGSGSGDHVARRTKLVCTIGPATADRVPELTAAGMDVARINFSHGTHDGHRAAADAVRRAAADAGRPVAILTDLAGPKIRLGELAGGSIVFRPADMFVLDASPDAPVQPGDRSGAAVSYPGLARDVRVGDRVLLADGAAELRVARIDGDRVTTEVVRGGHVRSRAGVSIPSERVTGPALTARDATDAALALELGADYVAQSFVRSADDVRELRALLGARGERPPIVAKIETRPAIDRFDEILDVADAVMIARGDLGVELPYEEVPIVQKQLLRRTLDRGVPSIVATQMLESMIASPRPTRAEASDVANAVFDGADAIMLSGETAIGDYPILAAEAAAGIARLCEERGGDLLPEAAPDTVETDARGIAYAAVALARADRDVAAIACYTRTGRTARVLAGLRPPVPVFAFSPDPSVIARLALVNSVVPHPCAATPEGGPRIDLLASLIGPLAALPAGAPVVLVASTAAPGTGPNLLEVRRVPGL